MDRSNENPEAQNTVEMENTRMVWDNLTLLKEFSNIVNAVSNEEFLDIVPPKIKVSKAKLISVFNCTKQSILDEMIQEINGMWQDENIPHKLEILEKQKEKFADQNIGQTVWRPQAGDIKAQLKVFEVERLQQEKKSLELLAKDYEVKIDRLKKTLPAKRAYLKALHMDIQKCQKNNEEFILKMKEKFENHSKIVNPLTLEENIKLNIDDDEDEGEWSVDNTKNSQ